MSEVSESQVALEVQNNVPSCSTANYLMSLLNLVRLEYLLGENNDVYVFTFNCIFFLTIKPRIMNFC